MKRGPKLHVKTVVHEEPKVEPKEVIRKAAVDLSAALLNLHRGIEPDVAALSPHEKTELKRLIEAESLSEATYKYPAREASRKRLRDKL